MLAGPGIRLKETGERSLNSQPAAFRLLSCLNVKLKKTGSEIAKIFRLVPECSRHASQGRKRSSTSSGQAFKFIEGIEPGDAFTKSSWLTGRFKLALSGHTSSRAPLELERRRLVTTSRWSVHSALLFT